MDSVFSIEFILKLHNVTWNEPLTISIVTHTSKLYVNGPIEKLWMVLMSHSVGYMFLSITKMNVKFLYSVSKYSKMKQKEIPFIGHNALQLFWVPLYTVFVWFTRKVLSSINIWYKCRKTNLNIHYKTNAYMCCNLFLSYADNRHTQTNC